MKRQKLKTFLAFGAIYIIWGSTFLATRYAVETIPPLMMVGIRSLTAGGILFALSRLKGREKIKKESILPLFALGAMFFLIGHGVLAWAQQYVPSGMAAVLITPEPLWILGMEWLFLRDTRVKRRGVLGLLLGFFGVAYIIASTMGNAASGNDFLGSLLIIAGTLAWGGGAIYSRVARIPKSPVFSSGMELIFGGALVLLSSFIMGEPSRFHASQVSLRSFLGLLYLIVFGSVIAFSAYVWLLGRTSVTRIATHTYVNPVIAVFLGWLLVDERITAPLLVATVVIIISVYLVLSDQNRHENIRPGEGTKD